MADSAIGAGSERIHAAADQIDQYRRKLLDLRNSNKLLNYKHSDRGRTHVRVIDELPDQLFRKLNEGKQLTFEALPEPDDNPKDEQTDRFYMAFEEARLVDPLYLEAIAKVADEDPEGTATQKLNRELKDRVRKALGLPPRPHPTTMSIAEYARRHGFDPNYDLPKPAGDFAKHQDSKIQTLLLPDDMLRKLSGVNDQARTNLQEKGVNTLYTAFGFLEWYENEQSDRPFYAPLLLLPVEMTRGVVRERYRYGIKVTGEEVQTNITLAARLAQNFQNVLPEFEGEDDTPERYFSRVTAAIAERKRWRVRRWITVGHFAFARLIMYQDLNPENWPGDQGLAQHKVLRDLFGGTTVGDNVFAEEYEVDQPRVAQKVPLLITDADSSQFSALVDAMDGKSMALQGPPGTGKSQTITNLIAAALAGGRRILFVAEKMAALEVVKNRLDAAGLGEFILELHSTKARKRDVLDSIESRLDIQNREPLPTNLEGDQEACEQVRQQLSRYVHLVNQTFGALGMTIQELFWAEVKIREGFALPAEVAKVRVPEASRYTPQRLGEMKECLSLLERTAAVFDEQYGGRGKHPWRGITKSDLTHFDHEAIQQLLHEWLELWRDLQGTVDEIRNSTGVSFETIEEVENLARVVVDLPEPSGVSRQLLAAMKALDVRQALLDFVDNMRVYRAGKEALGQVGDAEQLLCHPDLPGELSRIVAALRVGSQRVGDLNPMRAEAQGELEATERQLEDCHQLFELFGEGEKADQGTISPMLDAAVLLADLPDAAVKARTSALTDVESKMKLEGGRDRARKVSEAVARVEPFYRLPLRDSGAAQRMRRHARTLLDAGFFSFLSSEAREAKRYWRELRLAPGGARTESMAPELQALADVVEEVCEFREDSNLKNICGELFLGHETDFDLLLTINRFAEQARATLSTGQFQRALRDFLLQGDKKRLLEVAAFTRTDARDRLQRAVKELSCGKHRSLEQVLQEKQIRLAGFDALSNACAKLRLDANLELLWLNGIAGQVREAVVAKEAVESNESACRVLGSTYVGINTKSPELEVTVDWAKSLLDRDLPEQINLYLCDVDVIERRDTLLKSCAAFLETLSRIEEAATAAIATSTVDVKGFFGKPLRACSAAAAIGRIEEAVRVPGALSEWCAYLQALEAVNDAGLGPILRACAKDGRNWENLDQAFTRALYRTLLEAAYEANPELKRFSGVTQDQAREKFRKLDRKIIQQQRQALRAELSRRPIHAGNGSGKRSTWTGRALLENELAKQKRHIPLRSLLHRAGRAIQEAKPCFMMSPLSVAQYLRPDGLTFDLLVIDEASQMRPEDALGSIARSAQIVVVGDPQQLPPTSFFDRDEPPTDEEIEEEDRANNESILEVALTAFRPARRLRWHYRSRHGSLVAFSNHHFYQDNLIVFPAPANEGGDLGVKSVFIPNGHYRGSVNLPEAQRVANEALVFMRDRPEHSLGIVAMNQPQRDLILREIELTITKDRGAQEYVEMWESKDGGVERFFVKNLETVQGDERDVILISATYGPNESGRVMQRFGPINGQHGYRRLNVLFTRAKRRVVLFTSMGAGDIVLDEKSSAGKKALKAYLEYAQHGRLEPGEVSRHDPDSDFEVFVKEMLELRGYQAVPQIGVSGYWIDIGVRHPNVPGVFVLGVECDGAAYHSSKSARDRDRLRQEVLENLGWTIYRIWSTDWFADPKGEAAKLVAAVEKAAEKYLANTKVH